MMLSTHMNLDNKLTFSDIVDIHVRSLQETYGDIDPRLVGDHKSVSAYWLKIAANRYQLISIVENGQCVGFILATPSRFSEGNTWEIRAQYVLKSHQRRGVGRLLLSSIRELLAKDGIEEVDILVHRMNVKAQSFFTAMGAERKQDATVESGSGHVDTVLFRLSVRNGY